MQCREYFWARFLYVHLTTRGLSRISEQGPWCLVRNLTAHVEMQWSYSHEVNCSVQFAKKGLLEMIGVEVGKGLDLPLWGRCQPTTCTADGPRRPEALWEAVECWFCHWAMAATRYICPKIITRDERTPLPWILAAVTLLLRLSLPWNHEIRNLQVVIVILALTFSCDFHYFYKAINSFPSIFQSLSFYLIVSWASGTIRDHIHATKLWQILSKVFFYWSIIFEYSSNID